MSSDSLFDIAVIGGGIAGASVAAALAPHARVLLLEMESQPGYHATGRSAAVLVDTYGPAPVRALTRASTPFLERPSEDFTNVPLLSPRGVVMIAREDQLRSLDALQAELGDGTPDRRLDGDELAACLPFLKPGYAMAGLFNERARDIDVHALHQSYLRRFRGNGGQITVSAPVTALRHNRGLWHASAGDEEFRASVVVNAAGAWADQVAEMAEMPPVGLSPKRRSIAVIPAPSGAAVSDWAMVVDIDEEFYIKPDAGRLLISPADETLSAPCDSRPEEYDIALAVDRVERAVNFTIPRIENRWSGLRSFVIDKCPVCGFDANVPGFFWLAGQGGYGIQTAPALAELAAALLLDKAVPEPILAEGLDPADLSPARPMLDRERNLGNISSKKYAQ
ncbi:MAG: FAD-binding oxidoreductase [Alphaproteobacteria bacterium]|nr:MAG: FAD-binding oxidoreductase [Alphaproteobacteria bacterium]